MSEQLRASEQRINFIYTLLMIAFVVAIMSYNLLNDWAEYTTIDGKQDSKLDVVEMFINNSGETLDWMEKYYFQFGDEMKAFFHPAKANGDRQMAHPEVGCSADGGKVEARKTKPFGL